MDQTDRKGADDLNVQCGGWNASVVRRRNSTNAGVIDCVVCTKRRNDAGGSDRIATVVTRNYHCANDAKRGDEANAVENAFLNTAMNMSRSVVRARKPPGCHSDCFVPSAEDER